MWEHAQDVLCAAGYEMREGDSMLLRMCGEFALAGLLADCNSRELPEELEGVCVLRAVGAFLAVKQQFIPEDLESMDAGGVVEKLRLGDMDVTFSETARADAAGRMAALIEGLIGYGEEMVACCRKIRW